MKVFGDDNINVAEKLKVGLGRVENIVGKGENAGYQHFLLFPQCFQKASYTGSLKVVNAGRGKKVLIPTYIHAPLLTVLQKTSGALSSSFLQTRVH